jgi:hypothetical protein
MRFGSNLIWFILAGLTVLYLFIYVAGVYFTDEFPDHAEKFCIEVSGKIDRVLHWFCGVNDWERL